MPDLAPDVTDPQLTAWLADLERLTIQFHETVDPLDGDRLRWRPAPGAWSVAEVLEHLTKTNAPYLETIGAAIARGRREAVVGHGPFGYGFLGRWWVRALGPTNKRRMTTPSAFAPRAELDPFVARDRFFETQQGLDGLLRSADGLHLGRLKATSVASRLLRFNLATWFASLLAHEHRHLGQARRVLEAAGGS